MMGVMVHRLWRGGATVAGLGVAVGLALLLGGSASAANSATIALPDMRLFVPTNLISIGINPSSPSTPTSPPVRLEAMSP